MIRRRFKRAALRQSFDIEKAAAEFYQMFPERWKDIFFIDISLPNAPFLGAEQTPDTHLAMMRDNAPLNQKIKETQKENGGSRNIPCNRYGRLYDCILLNKPADHHQHLNFLGYNAPRHMTDAFIFDHESGHALGRNWYKKDRHLQECLGDAYAVIRHFQRFPQDPHMDQLVAIRAVEMAFNGDKGKHATIEVIKRVIDAGKKGKFENLTPAETIALAHRFVDDYAMDPRPLKQAALPFENLRGSIGIMLKGDMAPLRKLGEILINLEDPIAFRWGYIAFRAALNRQIACNGKRIQPQGEEWAEWLKKLDQHAATLNCRAPKSAGPS